MKALAVGIMLVLIGCAGRVVTVRAVPVPLPPPTQTVAQLQMGLAAPDPDARAAAALALAGAGRVPPDVRVALVKALTDDPEENVRLAAAWALGHVKSDAADAAPSFDYDEQPRLLRQSRPIYPQGAFDQKIQGAVEVDILIDEQGRVARAEVRKSIPALDAEALRTVKSWTFQPARKAGRPLPIMATAPVTFRIY